MDRPLDEVRPVGPFIRRGDEASKFDRVEVDRTPDEETHYTVKGFHEGDNLGLKVDTNALVLDSRGFTEDSYSIALGRVAINEQIEEDVAHLEFSPPPGEKVGIAQADQNITQIVLEP